MSALTGEGMDALVDVIEKTVNGGKTTEVFEFSQECGAAVSYLYKNATVLSCEYEGDRVKLIATLDARTKGTALRLAQEPRNKA